MRLISVERILRATGQVCVRGKWGGNFVGYFGEIKGGKTRIVKVLPCKIFLFIDWWLLCRKLVISLLTYWR